MGEQRSGVQGPYRSLPEGALPRPERQWKRWLVGLLGVLFPLLVLGIELADDWCKEVLFDPLPSGVHVFLVVLVPAANALALFWTTRFTWLRHALNGAALVVALVYTLIFLPVTPLALIAVLLYGLGLLALSPLFALIATLMARHLILARTLLDPKPKFAPRLIGALAAAALFGVAALPDLLTRYGLRLADSNDTATAQKGRAFLRRFSSTDAMLATCAHNIGRHTGSPLTLGFLFGDPVPPERAGAIFYRATGRVCRTQWAERESGVRGRGFATLAEDAQGPDQEDAEVELASSRLDASVDARAAVAYLEWTLVFKNVTSWQKEATAELQLPKDAVISRATLWIDGEPREAAFASRSQAREAYERVVSRRKDPLLVTSTGRGRVQLRCFPVPPHGEMKILVGISAPLPLETRDAAWLGLPSIVQRSFSQPSAHRLWVEAKQPFQLEGTAARGMRDKWTLDQSLPASALEPAAAVLKFDRRGASDEAWSPDPTDIQRRIEQRLEPYQRAALEDVTIVLDTSLRQEQAAEALRAALADLAPGTELSVLVASDADAIDLVRDRRIDPALSKQLDGALSELGFAGGADNVPALIRAVEQASFDQTATVLWLHGPQPYLFEHPDRVRQVLERASGNLSLFELQTTPGRNRVVEALEGARGFASATRRGGLEATLRAEFRDWSGGVRYRATRGREPSEAAGPPALQTSPHLARLWAYEEVERLAGDRNREEALKLASAFKLVTTVSGAVVLETTAQYAEAGLSPPTGENVPSVPEPEFWVLIGCALAFLVMTLVVARRLKPSEPACS